MANKGFWIPIELMDLDISWTKRILMSEISQLEMLDAGCVASNAHFAEKLKLTTRAVSKALNELVGEGLIALDNSNTRRNFGRKITIHQSSTTIHQSSDSIHQSGESKDSNPLKSSYNNPTRTRKSKFCDSKLVDNAFEVTWLEHKEYRKTFGNKEHGKKGKAHLLYKRIVQSMYDEHFTGKDKIDEKYVTDIFENTSNIIETYRHGLKTQYLQNILDPETILERLENMEF